MITWSDIVNLIKRNKKCEICYNNFAFWNIETLVDVKCQKQPPRGVLKIPRDIWLIKQLFVVLQFFFGT